MALVSESCGDGDIGDRLTARQQFLCTPNPHLPEVGMRGNADCLAKDANEVIAAEVCEL